MLFFHIFKIHHSITTSVKGHGLISLHECDRMFEVYSDNVKHFKDQLFLVIPLKKEVYAKNFSIDPRPPY